jgi:hypothetical protein
MKKIKKIVPETGKEKEERIMLMRRKTYNWDKTDMKYCIANQLSIYPACQSNGTLLLFVQHKENFKRLDDKVYRQSTEEEILTYSVVIIDAYTEYANKRRLKEIKND